LRENSLTVIFTCFKFKVCIDCFEICIQFSFAFLLCCTSLIVGQ